jgi:hypothetical protein
VSHPVCLLIVDRLPGVKDWQQLVSHPVWMWHQLLSVFRTRQSLYLLLTNMLIVTPVVVSLSHKAISFSTINKHAECDTSCCQSFAPGNLSHPACLLIVDRLPGVKDWQLVSHPACLLIVDKEIAQSLFLLLTNMLNVTAVVVSLSHQAISLSTINKHAGCDTSCQSFTLLIVDRLPGVKDWQQLVSHSACLLIVDKEIAWCERLTTTGVTSSMFVNSR